LQHYFDEYGFDKETNPFNPYHTAAASPAHSSISSTGTIPAEIDENQLVSIFNIFKKLLNCKKFNENYVFFQ